MKKFPKSDKQLKVIRDTWLTVWQSSNRKVPFPRAVNDEFRKIGTTAREVEDMVSSLLVCKSDELSREQQLMVAHYRDMVHEVKQSIEEDVADNPRSATFILQSKYGYQNVQTIKVEDGNLADIVKEHTPHG